MGHTWEEDKVVGLHFDEGEHSGKDLKVQIIGTVKTNTYYKKTREEFWMNKSTTVNPFGFNVKSVIT